MSDRRFQVIHFKVMIYFAFNGFYKAFVIKILMLCFLLSELLEGGVGVEVDHHRRLLGPENK